MGILVGMGWIILGILYIIYKFGEEELRLGTAGGLGCVIAVIVGFLLLSSLIWLCTSITGDDATAGFWVGGIFFTCIFAFVLYGSKSEKKEKKKLEQMKKDWHEIELIQNSLPMPTVSQMRSFIYEIQSAHPRSSQQQELYDRMVKYESGGNCQTIDAHDFKKFQAAWIYYSKQETLDSEWRSRFFGDQDIQKMRYFDPSTPRDGEKKYARNYETLRGELSKIPTKINREWCSQPKFAKRVFEMIENGSPISEEDLYPIMLKSYVKSSDWSLHWMQEDMGAVWISLLPKMIHALSQISMSRKEEDEWLKVESFQLACLLAIREKQFLKNEDLFPILLEIYNDLLDKEFSCQPSKHNFVTLWYGLNGVGKAVGKNASFFDYPKYIIK